MDFTHYGITSVAAGINKIFQTEMTHAARHQIKRGKVVPTPLMPITSNADWWVSQWGEIATFNLNGTISFGNVVLYLDLATGVLTHATQESTAIYNMYVSKYGHEAAQKLATVTYYFTVRENALTSIMAGAKFSNIASNGLRVDNVSLLNLEPWQTSPYLGQQHTVVWCIGHGNFGQKITELRIEARMVKGQDTCSITVRPQHVAGTIQPQPITLSNQPVDILNGINVLLDQHASEASYMPENNSVVLSDDRINKFANIRIELWPTDHVNKTETDNSPIYQL